MRLFRADGTESQTALHLDTRAAKDEVQTLKNEVVQIFQLDKSTPLRISYMGKIDDSVAGPLDKGNRLNTPNCISELDLDSSIFHQVHVEEKWQVQLQIDVPGKVMERNFSSNETILQIQQAVLNETSWDKVLLYYGKDPVNKKAKIGDLSVDDSFKLFATQPSDKGRRDNYLATI